MTLEEAIKHAEEVAKATERQQERHYESNKLYENTYDQEKMKQCELCAAEHRQLAEWLRDYKRLKEQENDLTMGQIVRGIHALSSVKSQEQKTDWIPVSERLPEWDVDCLVVDADGNFGVGYYREDAKAWDSPCWGWLERKDKVDNHEACAEPCGIRKVIAWMSLPEPYKGKEGRNDQRRNIT